MMRSTLHAGAAAASALLAAGVALAAPEAAVPEAARLAALAFPGWDDSVSGRVQTVQVPPGGGGGHTGWRAGALRVVVEPRLVLREGERLTLIAGLVPAAEDGHSLAAPVTPMALAAYQFERSGGAWKLSARQGIFAWRGFEGTATLRAVALAERRQGLGVEYGSCWQGYCGTWLALYELDKGTVRPEPAVELALSGSNVGGVGDCPRRLQPLLKPRPDSAQRGEAGEQEHDCYAVESSWTLDPAGQQPGDLSIRYQGALSRAGTRLSPPIAIDQRQVLRYGSGKYRAVSGFNPVPAL